MKFKFAIVEGQRREAAPGLKGECPICGAAMVARCGEIRVWHWAHRGRRNCDHWWENETEWHRNWKSQFPIEWQEVVQTADDGEKHIADVKTEQGWVLEFQHSYLKPDERRSREAFYGNMVWIINGLRRMNDLKQFVRAVTHGTRISERPLLVKVQPEDCRLVAEWSTSRVPVFLDFGDKIHPRGLWLLVPVGWGYSVQFALISKEQLIGWLRKGDFNPQTLIDQLRTLERLKDQVAKARRTSHRTLQWMPQRRRRRL